MPITFFTAAPTGWPLVLYLCAVLLSGFAIGAVGIGGVFLVPLLLLLDVPVRVASFAVLSSFLLAGIVAVASNWRQMPRARAVRICVAAAPGAMCGALAIPLLPPACASRSAPARTRCV